MTDSEPHAQWIELETVVHALRHLGHTDVAARLIAAERGGVTGSEILGNLGRLLNENAALRATLDDDARHAWDAVIRDVGRAFPGFRLRAWLACLLPRLNLRAATRRKSAKTTGTASSTER